MLIDIDYDKILSNPNLYLDKDVNKLTLPEIKEELKKLTDVESKTGFLYFCLNYAKVSHPTRGAISFKEEIYPWQLKAAIDFLTYKRIITSKRRQQGVSTLVALYALYRAIFFPAQEINIFSKTLRDSTIFLDKRVKFPYDHLPVWMAQKTSEFAKTSVTFSNNKSHLTSLPSTGGRGDSISLVIGDESAFYPRFDEFMAGVVPALAAGFNTPFSNKSLPSQMILISTNAHNTEGNGYMRLLISAKENIKDSEFYVLEPSTEGISYYQDENWLKQQKETLGERLYKIEILGEIPTSAENSFFSQECIDRLKPGKVLRTDFLKAENVNEFGEPINLNDVLLFKDNFDKTYSYIKGLFIYKDVIPEKQYCIFCDVASGKGSDYSTIHVFDLETFEQVAEYRNKINLEAFKEIIWLITQYYNMAKLSIESNGLGENLCDYFYNTLAYENFYVHQHSKNKVSPGFPMNNNTRPNALAIMAKMLEKDEMTINGLRTINELKMFGYSGNKIQGLEGSNDDLVMGIAQACFLRQNGFAASDKAIMNNLLYGEMIEEIEKKEEEAKSLHFLNKRNDIIVDDETTKFLKAMNSLGFGISKEELDKMVNNASY